MRIKDLKQLEREELEKFTIRLFEINLKLQDQIKKLEQTLEQYKQMVEAIENYFGGHSYKN
jgi:cell division septum initiation protein DivIVA